jgi:hypothetical protein
MSHRTPSHCALVPGSEARSFIIVLQSVSMMAGFPVHTPVHSIASFQLLPPSCSVLASARP